MHIGMLMVATTRIHILGWQKSDLKIEKTQSIQKKAEREKNEWKQLSTLLEIKQQYDGLKPNYANNKLHENEIKVQSKHKNCTTEG